MSRKLLLALTVASFALVGVAGAATPKTGGFAYSGHNNSEAVAFVVQGKPRKIEDAFASSLGCNGGEPVTIAKRIKVKGSGKFKYSGKAAFLSGSETQVTFKGKFVSAKKAKGEVKIQDCKGIHLEFTAKWAAGG